jgi:hypothetical protein
MLAKKTQKNIKLTHILFIYIFVYFVLMYLMISIT